MEIIKYVLIALLLAQFFFSGALRVLVGLVVWTLVWLPVAFILNLVVTDPLSYAGFWVAMFDWESSTWADLIHANIGAGLGTIMALLGGSKRESVSVDQSHEAKDQEPKT